MNANDPLLADIRQKLADMLNGRHCTSGHFRMERPSSNMLLTMHGERPDLPKPVFFWEWPNPVKRSISVFLDANPDLAVLEMKLDLVRNAMEVYTQNRAEYNEQKEKEAQQRQAELQQAQLEKRRQLATLTQPYGPELALRVTEQLLKGYFLGYGHRDYCGTGLERNEKGQIVYGEIYDGGMILPLQVFETSGAFAEWLAVQSDASMARLDSTEPFYWGNQTITEQRLREFAPFTPGSFQGGR
ncbi:MAG: hypothetical protein ACT6QS_06705 [Flavobacteriales bacterium]